MLLLLLLLLLLTQLLLLPRAGLPLNRCGMGRCLAPVRVGALLVVPAAAARLISQSLKGFFFLSVVIATISTLFGILLPIVFARKSNG